MKKILLAACTSTILGAYSAYAQENPSAGPDRCYAADAAAAAGATAVGALGAKAGAGLVAWFTGAACTAGAAATLGLSCLGAVIIVGGIGLMVGAEAGGELAEEVAC